MNHDDERDFQEEAAMTAEMHDDDDHEAAAMAVAGYDEIHRELLDTRRRLDEAIRALRVLGDAVRAVAGSADTTRGVQSVCSLAALHVDQVLLELTR